MNNKLTPGNIKMVGVTADTHARLKRLAELYEVSMYEAAEMAVDKLERWTDIEAAFDKVKP
ncbi:MAG: hypothetical protein IPK44_01355 [Candidatus Accumulibacter sp.]|uniref:hypothetical protein n=1 Tax=Accumulibacter sp. TaxID=2053492 RepID=UPI002582687B|nr:hypothetical protein [Accumulibacter sp.]MBK8113246.1 hypothetical protein [Accumulibacter sp.]